MSPGSPKVKKKRCSWSTHDELYQSYHDQEWGVPVHDDRTLFEMLNLEGAQAGLSWITVLRKRENYRKAFDRFDAKKIALYDSRKKSALLKNPGIVRHPLKIEAVVLNAKAYLAVKQEFGSFDRYLWSFVGGQTHPWRKTSCEFSGERGHESRSQEARLQVRRRNDLLCIHASRRDGQ